MLGTSPMASMAPSLVRNSAETAFQFITGSVDSSNSNLAKRSFPPSLVRTRECAVLVRGLGHKQLSNVARRSYPPSRVRISAVIAPKY